MEKLIQIKLSYACFGLIVIDNIVVEAPPIAYWTIGKDIKYVTDYYKRQKNGEIIFIPH